MRSIFRSLFVIGWLLAASSARADAVIASIKPVSLIAAELLDGVVEVETLLPDGASPHDFSLRPSDRRTIDGARLIIWVGPETEPYLQRVIAAADVPQITWQESEAEHAEHTKDHTAGRSDKHDHDHDHGHGDSHGHEDNHSDSHGHEASHEDSHQDGHRDSHEDTHKAEMDSHDAHEHGDIHPWLSPESAEHFAERLAQKLKEIFPLQASKIEENERRFIENLATFNTDARQQLAAVQSTGFFVFHDAYQGLVEHFELNQVGYFMLDPSRKPGAKHLNQLRQQLEQSAASCVFVEPQFAPALIDSITRGLDIRRGELDPLASGITPATGSYLEFMKGLVDQFNRCLAP